MKLTHIVLQNVEWWITCYCYQITTVSPIYILQQAQVINPAAYDNKKKDKGNIDIQLKQSYSLLHSHQFDVSTCTLPSHRNKWSHSYTSQAILHHVYVRQRMLVLYFSSPEITAALISISLRNNNKACLHIYNIISTIRCSKLKVNYCYNRSNELQ